jgi:hypothetical protein
MAATWFENVGESKNGTHWKTPVSSMSPRCICRYIQVYHQKNCLKSQISESLRWKRFFLATLLPLCCKNQLRRITGSRKQIVSTNFGHILHSLTVFRYAMLKIQIARSHNLLPKFYLYSNIAAELPEKHVFIWESPQFGFLKGFVQCYNVMSNAMLQIQIARSQTCYQNSIRIVI